MAVLIRNLCEHVTISKKQWVIRTNRHTLSPILTAWPKITQQETLTQDDGGGGGGDQDGDQVLLQSVPLDADQLLLQARQQGGRPVYKGLHFLLKQCLLQPNLFYASLLISCVGLVHIFSQARWITRHCLYLGANQERNGDL